MEYLFATIIVAVLIALAIGLSFSMGSNDETSAPLAGAGTLKLKIVLIIGGAGLAFGTIFLSRGVASMVGAKILGPSIKYTVYMLLAVLISSIIWLLIGSFLGISLSSTHTFMGSIFGAIIVYIIFVNNVSLQAAFSWDKIGLIMISWLISPLLGFFITFALCKLIQRFYISKKKGLNEIEKSERNFAWLLIIAIIFAEIWVGANSAEALGILYALYSNGTLDIVGYYFFVVILALMAFLGLFLVGRFLIRNLASQLTDSRPSDGFVIQISSALILMVFTVIFSVPISHSHVIVFCIIGLNVAQKREIDIGNLGKMIMFWLLTFPIAAIIAGFIYFGFISFGLI